MYVQVYDKFLLQNYHFSKFLYHLSLISISGILFLSFSNPITFELYFFLNLYFHQYDQNDDEYLI